MNDTGNMFLCKRWKKDIIIEFSKEVIEIELNKISDKEIGAMVKKGLPSGFPAFSEFLKKDPDGNSFFTLSSRILDVLSKTKMKKDKIIEFRIYDNCNSIKILDY